MGGIYEQLWYEVIVHDILCGVVKCQCGVKCQCVVCSTLTLPGRVAAA